MFPLPEPEVDIHYEGLLGSSIALHVDYIHYEGCEDDPLYIENTRIIFNIKPELVPESEIVTVDYQNGTDHNTHLADIIATGIGWEMTTWTVMNTIGYHAAKKFDHFIMWTENPNKHWFLPIPESDP